MEYCTQSPLRHAKTPRLGGLGPTLPPSGSVLTQVARYLPLRPLIVASFAAFDPRHRGGAFLPIDLLTMAARGLAALVLAVLLFRWEPRKA